MAVLVAIGIAVAVYVLAVFARNRMASIEARDAIARAIRSSKDAKVIRDLQTADQELVTLSRTGKAERELNRLLDKLREAEKNSFGSEGKINIREPEV